MMALSIRQPWAWLIVNGFKDIENRSWPTGYRGRFLVHASKVMTRADYEAVGLWLVGGGVPTATVEAIWERFPQYDALRAECGGIVGSAEIAGQVRRLGAGVLFSPSDLGRTTLAERTAWLGSPWFEDQIGFCLRDAQPLPFRPCKGALGFFKVEGA